MRTCRKCNVRPATSARGPATCEECRSQPKDYTKRLRIKTCVECGAEFRTRSASDYCNRCNHERSKHPCIDCGEMCDGRSERCHVCAGRLRRGSAAYNWRGGRTVNALTGYARVRRPEHPRANNAYVLEHVAVMEDHIGRYLWRNESVHHKNGQRADNRIENLELWVKTQPAGQRATDLLAWAREIIDQYGDTPL